MASRFDYLIVGAGLSGLVIAERLTTQCGKTCLIVDRRGHIGGNCFDEYDSFGVLIHKYGPHYFRTNSQKVIDYLSLFTDWTPAFYRVLSFTRGQYWSFPINLHTFEQLIGRQSTPLEFQGWLDERRVPISNPSNSEELIISQIGWDLYELFYKGYTTKQWKRHPMELDASICGRIPIRITKNDLYFNDRFQAMPSMGYHSLFERMILSCGNKLRILLNTDLTEVTQSVQFSHIIYTGKIDEYYDYCYGHLPYRSLTFEYQSFDENILGNREEHSRKKGFWQPVVQVNYPNDYEYTRIVEIKHATGQSCANTTISKEYPADCGIGREPYYPIPNPTSLSLYNRYKQRADSERDISFIGRLATYSYLNMDQIVELALSEYERIKETGTI